MNVRERSSEERQEPAGQELADLVARVGPPDAAAAEEAARHQGRLAKPAGALGVLEDVSIMLAALAGRCPPPVPERAVVAVFAADHGVHARGVSPWPQEVTAQMVATFLSGRAAVNVLAEQIGARVLVIDVGVANDIPGGVPTDGMLRSHRVRSGTRDLSSEAAMTRAEAIQALLVGARVATDLIGSGTDVLLTGDMGIANTTASAALTAAFCGVHPRQATGRGTGIDEQTWHHKVAVVGAALECHHGIVADRDTDPLAVLAALGGLEHAAIAGLLLSAAAHRVPVILDGAIAGAAALVATALAPPAVHALVAGHRSVEPAHTLALERLGLRPLVDLELRLGEGTGALLALPIVQSAARVLRDMATLDEAQVTS